MQPPLPLRFSRAALLLLATAGLFAACDRHSATEVSEGYGHGSSHDKSYKDHQIDSREHSFSFSDTQGTSSREGSASKGDSPAPGAEATPAKHFF